MKNSGISIDSLQVDLRLVIPTFAQLFNLSRYTLSDEVVSASDEANGETNNGNETLLERTFETNNSETNNGNETLLERTFETNNSETNKGNETLLERTLRKSTPTIMG